MINGRWPGRWPWNFENAPSHTLLPSLQSLLDFFTWLVSLWEFFDACHTACVKHDHIEDKHPSAKCNCSVWSRFPSLFKQSYSESSTMASHKIMKPNFTNKWHSFSKVYLSDKSTYPILVVAAVSVSMFSVFIVRALINPDNKWTSNAREKARETFGLYNIDKREKFHDHIVSRAMETTKPQILSNVVGDINSSIVGRRAAEIVRSSHQNAQSSQWAEVQLPTIDQCKCDRISLCQGCIRASWNNNFIQCITLPTKSFLDTCQFRAFNSHHSTRYILLCTQLSCPRFEQNCRRPIPSNTLAGPWSSWIIFYSAIKWISIFMFVLLFCILKLRLNQSKAALPFSEWAAISDLPVTWCYLWLFMNMVIVNGENLFASMYWMRRGRELKFVCMQNTVNAYISECRYSIEREVDQSCITENWHLIFHDHVEAMLWGKCI